MKSKSKKSAPAAKLKKLSPAKKKGPAKKAASPKKKLQNRLIGKSAVAKKTAPARSPAAPVRSAPAEFTSPAVTEKPAPSVPASAAAQIPIEKPAGTESSAGPGSPANFIRTIIEKDLADGKHAGRVATRFPPEPNGYLHIGHAKSICLNFGLARDFKGTCNLRFDDTNPAKEAVEYINAIIQDVRWLGFDWEDRLYHASDYFSRMYECAELLIQKNLAYVCECTPTEVRENRGTLTAPGKPCNHRKRGAEENLDSFQRMRAGEFADGSRVLRARIDMGSNNINMRDPVLYRILRASHPHVGDSWRIYPMYDFAHPLEDAVEKITHSICTLEFEDHRPFYDWLIRECDIQQPRPQQIEFARLNLTYTVMSKRKLLDLVEGGHVNGWDDPRMPTLAGMRRRGYTPEAVRNFCDAIGVARANSVVDFAMLEFFVREDLNKKSPRAMVVLRPLKVVIDNYPEDQTEEMEAPINPENPAEGSRKIPFSKVLYIEQDDFREEAPRKYHRLAPGAEVRLMHAYYIRCERVVKDAAGAVIEVGCTYDSSTRGGWSTDGRNVKGTLHWVCADHAVPVEARLYDHLFVKPNPEEAPEGSDFRANLNPNSCEILTSSLAEPGLVTAAAGSRFQFLRNGYFTADPDSKPGHLVFNRTVSLRDSWAKIEKSQTV